MRTWSLAIGLYAFAAALPAAAAVIVVPLTLPETPLSLEALAAYPLAFDAGGALLDIHQVGIRLQGSETYFRDYCWDSGDPDGGSWYHQDVLGLTIALEDGGTTLADTLVVFDPADHPGDLGAVLDGVVLLTPDGDWSDLADGVGTVVLTGLACGYAPVPPEACACDPSFTVTEAVLIVATGTDVPAASTTWSALKARFR